MSKSFFILIMVFFYILISSSINSLTRKLDRVGRKLDFLLDDRDISGSVDIPKELEIELLDLIRSSKRVAAVKRLREETGLDLLEAKNYIDDLDKK